LKSDGILDFSDMTMALTLMMARVSGDFEFGVYPLLGHVLVRRTLINMQACGRVKSRRYIKLCRSYEKRSYCDFCGQGVKRASVLSLWTSGLHYAQNKQFDLDIQVFSLGIRFKSV